MISEFATVDRMMRVRGMVQGVGFRPFVLRLAGELGLSGWVRNDAFGVLVRIAGVVSQVEDFALWVVERAPVAARVTSVEWLDGPLCEPMVVGSFQILDRDAAVGEIETAVPADLAPCADCRREMADPSNRRFGYPFINCTQCGPRYTLIESLPYDRAATTMSVFSMCPDCQQEYENPHDRRFHAEPNACPVCGPRLSLTDKNGVVVGVSDEALELAVAAMLGGKMVAVKGVGGFLLMADATDEMAVAELRSRKHREQKPLAVMFRDLAMLEQCAVVTDAARDRLESPWCPIVLVEKRLHNALASGIAPGNPWLGALMPSSPLHVLLLELAGRPLVATSGNLADEPLCIDDGEARERLAGVADYFLGNDRAIVRPVDDSIVRITEGGAAIMLRRARGVAPAPFELPSALAQPVLCVGAQMKNTVAVASQRRLVLSPHIGDLGGLMTQQVFEHTIDALSALLSTRPSAVVCDKHPDYDASRFAARYGLPVIAVQHHLAHVLAVLLENHHPADGVLGIAWDGTGYGEDGTVWGGEFILLDRGRASRFARMVPFRLPGGEAAVRDTRRMVVALAHASSTVDTHAVAQRFGFSAREATVLCAMLDQAINTPVCTSVGRLFDGFGALMGLGSRNAYEGQVPMAVEIAARASGGVGEVLPFPVVAAEWGALWEIDWQPAFCQCLERNDLSAAQAAAAFHRGLAVAARDVCRHAGVGTIALAGGCFQNALLRDLVEAMLVTDGFNVITPHELPPNDGAIAAGQSLAALWNLTTVENF